MKSKTLLSALVFSILSLTTFVAAAQFGMGRAMEQLDALEKNFTAADHNHDGMLTREEAERVPFINANFDRIDTRHQGQVSVEDVKVYIRAVASKMGQAPDTLEDD